MNVELRVSAEPAAEAGALLAEAARAGGRLALGGGSTAGAAYGAAATAERDWSRAVIWFGDDRAVPPDDERSNYRVVREALLQRVSRRPAVHRIEGELGADEAAERYDRALVDAALSFALNGIGADGHTASLFPASPALTERRRRAVAAEAKLEPLVPRVTLTPWVFAEVDVLVYLVTGRQKAEAVARAFAAEPSEDVPASLVRGRHTIALLDEAAASHLPGRST